MKDIFIYILLLFLIPATLSTAYVEHKEAQTAYLRGKQDQYMAVQSTFHDLDRKAEELALEIKKVNESLMPEAMGQKLPTQKNAKGEVHPALTNSGTLKNFIFNNCSRESITIADDVITYAKDHSVRPEIVYAIAWADSRCGQDLTTPNNVGNVANNDRGNRVGYFTLLAGYKAIVDTLNNKYMGGLSMVGQLSQGGRVGTELYAGIGAKYDCADAPAPYKCWATSSENHYNNSMRALIAMGLNPTASWEFRIR